MSNDYFQFKQFKVQQERCAMKVTTDACIQGAWTPVLEHVQHALDIGTGTGLLALMLAQKDNIHIDAIEFDKNAVQQAACNVAASPWSDRISVVEGDVRGYNFGRKYDLIICNPPFFNNSLLSADDTAVMARHTLHLSYDDLLQAAINNLQRSGYLSVMLPHAEYQQWKRIAEHGGLYESGRLLISHTEGAPVKRVVGLFSINDPSFVMEEKLVIKNADGQYTPAFTALLAPFYLHL